MVTTKHSRRQVVNISVLAALSVACVFFLFWDIFYEQISWTLWFYVTCFLLFGFGFLAWIVASSHGEKVAMESESAAVHDNETRTTLCCALLFECTHTCHNNYDLETAILMMRLFGLISSIQTICLIGYGIYLCIISEWIWAPLTFVFGFLTAVLARSALAEAKSLDRECCN